MARKVMVTRTIKSIDVTALCIDLIKTEPCNRTVTLGNRFKNEKDMAKKLSEMLDTDDFKFVKIVHTAEHETLYGMTEEDFIAHAIVIPAKGDSATDNDNN